MRATSTQTEFVVSDELVARIRLGDDDALERLVRIASTPLQRFAVRLTGAPDVAQDVVQDVLCKVWRLGASWNPNGSARSYLYASVRNAILNLRKHDAVAERFREESLRAAAIGDDALMPGPEAALEFAERVAVLGRLISELPERQRTALRLRYEEQLTVPEVAAVLGVTTKAAEALLSRSVKALRARALGDPVLIERTA